MLAELKCLVIAMLIPKGMKTNIFVIRDVLMAVPVFFSIRFIIISMLLLIYIFVSSVVWVAFHVDVEIVLVVNVD